MGPLESTTHWEAGGVPFPCPRPTPPAAPEAPPPVFSHLCPAPPENPQPQTPGPGLGRATEPTLKSWLPAVTRTMVPRPRLSSEDSSPNISRRNLFWEERTRASMSLLSTSRFFSRKPAGKQSPPPSSATAADSGEGRARCGHEPPAGHPLQAHLHHRGAAPGAVTATATSRGPR